MHSIRNFIFLFLIALKISFASPSSIRNTFQLACEDEADAEQCEYLVRENRCSEGSSAMRDSETLACRKSCGLCKGGLQKVVQMRGENPDGLIPTLFPERADSESTLGSNTLPTSSCKDLDPSFCKSVLGGTATGNPNPSPPVVGGAVDSGANPQGQGLCCALKAAYNASCAKTCHFCTETSLPLSPLNNVAPNSVVTQQDPCSPTGGSPPTVGVGSSK